MNADEKEIVDYLKGWPNSFVSGREIARKVGGRERYEEDRGWALPTLVRMVQNKLLETDHMGCYRLIPTEKKKRKNEQHVSPQLLKILKSSGKSFEGVTLDDDTNSNPIPEYRPPRGSSGS